MFASKYVFAYGNVWNMREEKHRILHSKKNMTFEKKKKAPKEMKVMGYLQEEKYEAIEWTMMNVYSSKESLWILHRQYRTFIRSWVNIKSYVYM